MIYFVAHCLYIGLCVLLAVFLLPVACDADILMGVENYILLSTPLH